MYIRQASAHLQASFVLTALVFFGVAEVVNERTRTKRTQDHTYSFPVSNPLGNLLEPSSLHLSLQLILRKRRHIHLQNFVSIHLPWVLSERQVVIYQRSLVAPINLTF